MLEGLHPSASRGPGGGCFQPVGQLSSEESVAPLLQTLSARAGLAHVGTANVFQPLGEQLHILLQQQELTEHHVRLEMHHSQAAAAAKGVRAPSFDLLTPTDAANR